MATKTEAQKEQARLRKEQAMEKAHTKAARVAPKAPPPAELIAESGVCINCRYLAVGTWRGPTCSNSASKFHKQRMPDQGSCDKFSNKHSRQTVPAVVSKPVGEFTNAPTEDEGLYDPTPLNELLARETEGPDNGSE